MAAPSPMLTALNPAIITARPSSDVDHPADAERRDQRVPYVCRASQQNLSGFCRSLRRNRLRAAVEVDAHVGEQPFCHLDRGEAGAAPRPAFDLDGDRGVADLLDGTVAGDFVADADRAMKRHG